MKTTWRKMESWKPEYNAAQKPSPVWFLRGDQDAVRKCPTGRVCMFTTRKSALRAANKQNQKEGLPQVE